DQMLRDRDEIREHIGLVLAVAAFVPALALLPAASDMRDRVDEAAIDQRQDARIEGGLERVGVAAIAFEKERRLAIEGEALAMQHGDGNLLVVGRGREQ